MVKIGWLAVLTPVRGYPHGNVLHGQAFTLSLLFSILPKWLSEESSVICRLQLPGGGLHRFTVWGHCAFTRTGFRFIDTNRQCNWAVLHQHRSVRWKTTVFSRIKEALLCKKRVLARSLLSMKLFVCEFTHIFWSSFAPTLLMKYLTLVLNFKDLSRPACLRPQVVCLCVWRSA